LKSELKSKSRRRRNVVEKSQSESETFDAIDVGHYVYVGLSSVSVTATRIGTICDHGNDVWTDNFTRRT